MYHYRLQNKLRYKKLVAYGGVKVYLHAFLIETGCRGTFSITQSGKKPSINIVWEFEWALSMVLALRRRGFCSRQKLNCDSTDLIRATRPNIPLLEAIKQKVKYNFTASWYIYRMESKFDKSFMVFLPCHTQFHNSVLNGASVTSTSEICMTVQFVLLDE
jgi:hypothetical protein